MEKKKTAVKINGKIYNILHDESEEYIQRVAIYLNNKILSAPKGGLSLGEPTVLVMAALDITDELFKAQKNFNTVSSEIKRMMDEYDSLKSELIEKENELDAAQKKIDDLKAEIIRLRGR